jgi:hypothetical protein
VSDKPSDQLPTEDKPKFAALDCRGLRFEVLLDFYRQLIGREPTVDELEDARHTWDEQSRSTGPERE